MNLLHAVPYLFEGELESVKLKATDFGQQDIYAVSHGNVIRFETSSGNETDIQAIVESDLLDENDNLVKWEPVFYESQSEERRAEIIRTAPERFKGNSLLTGIEAVLLGDNVTLVAENGDKFYKGGMIDDLVFETKIPPSVEDLDFDDYRISREHISMEWTKVENG